MLCVEDELGRCEEDDVTVVVEEELVVVFDEEDVVVEDDDGAVTELLFVPPMKVLEAVEEETVFAGYVCGPVEGPLEDEELEEPEELELPELEDVVLELLEDAEELSSGSLSEDEPVCELSGSSKLSGSNEPETIALSPSMIFTFPSVPPPEQPESTQIAAASEIAPLNLFFIIHFPNF